MSEIRMVDLVAQYHKIKEEVDQAVINVVESSAYINGVISWTSRSPMMPVEKSL